MKGSVRIVAVLVVIATASLSMTHFEVTDSWYSDSERLDVVIVTGSNQNASPFSSVDGGMIFIEGSVVSLTSVGEDGSTFIFNGESIEFQVDSSDCTFSVKENASVSDNILQMTDGSALLVEGTLVLTPIP
ncbi:MAG: hypothetical protein IKD00_06895 [Candidatus Methanomethylophilaceae archaeon]|nr:hypothetical protein [Candidatus Methanomethylophilaceae archaeon]